MCFGNASVLGHSREPLEGAKKKSKQNGCLTLEAGKYWKLSHSNAIHAVDRTGYDFVQLVP